MSDTESDSDLDVDVERYDPEDNLNVYGSPIHESSSHEIVGAEQAEPLISVEEAAGPSSRQIFDRTQVRSRFFTKLK